MADPYFYGTCIWRAYTLVGLGLVDLFCTVYHTPNAMKHILAIPATFLLHTLACAQDDAWTSIADFSGIARTQAVSFVIGDKGYVGTGWWPGVRRDVHAYDPTSNTWDQVADLGGDPRYGAVGFAIAGKGYIALGTDGFDEMSDVWEYDPNTDAWTERASFPGMARHGAVAFTIAGMGYVCTGAVGSWTSNELWAYDPVHDKWTRKTDLPGAGRTGAAAFVLEGKGYLAAGADEGDLPLKDLWEYDPVMDTWCAKTGFGEVERTGAAAFAVNGRGYVAGGADADGSHLNELWEFDPALNAWTERTGLMGEGLAGAVGFSIDGTGYFGTGRTDGNGIYTTGSFWSYSPAATTTGLNVPDTDMDVSAYPNPTMDLVSISWPAEADRQVRFMLLNMAGQMLENRSVRMGQPLSLDLSSYPEGSYLLQLTTETGRVRTVRLERMR